MRGDFWTPEREAELRRIRTEHPEYSYDKIGKLMAISRNAAIGKATRLGLRSTAPVARASPGPAGEIQKPPKPNVVVMEAPPGPFLDKDGKPYNMLTAPMSVCRWPYGAFSKGDFHYCGHSAVRHGAPWCQYHRRVVFEQATKNPMKDPSRYY